MLLVNQTPFPAELVFSPEVFSVESDHLSMIPCEDGKSPVEIFGFIPEEFLRV